VGSTSAVPANVVHGDIVTGSADAPHTVSIYLDSQCPACRAFETQNGAWLEGLRDAGKIRLELKPIAILDRFSSTQYSTRAANAAACVADSSPEAYTAFNDELFAQQPPENSAGLPDDKLVEIARDAGAAPAVEQCITDGTFTGWVARTTDAASRSGVQGTPTVLVDGHVVDNPTRPALEAALG
jgi:protein-disulfide isomerase